MNAEQFRQQLAQAVTPLYYQHLAHAQKQRQREQDINDLTPDPTRMEIAVLALVKPILAKNTLYHVEVKLLVDWNLRIQAWPERPTITQEHVDLEIAHPDDMPPPSFELLILTS